MLRTTDLFYTEGRGWGEKAVEWLSLERQSQSTMMPSQSACDHEAALLWTFHSLAESLFSQCLNYIQRSFTRVQG